MNFPLKILSVITLGGFPGHAPALPDIRSVEADLVVPIMTKEAPAAGKRVRHTLPDYAGTEVHHSLYLPVNWRPDSSWPVIVEYAGNGNFRNDFGDTCSGMPGDCSLGYGISGGQDFIWICLPYVSEDHHQNEIRWWGDRETTVQYAKDAVRMVCEEFGGDPGRVLLTGFSRGAIGVNYLGLYDDEIAGLWAGMITHDHYDGVKRWAYPESDPDSARERLQRLEDTPQFISQSKSTQTVEGWVLDAYPKGNFTFQSLPYRNHTDRWVLRDIPERERLQEWVREVLSLVAP